MCPEQNNLSFENFLLNFKSFLGVEKGASSNPNLIISIRIHVLIKRRRSIEDKLMKLWILLIYYLDESMS
jgi:hypothetical protein